jgi:hypothetical protein
MLVPSACTRDNPAFDAGTDYGTDVGSASIGGQTTGGASSLGTTGPDATQGIDDTATTVVTDTNTSLTDGTTGEPTCSMHEDAPILMTVLGPDNTIIPPSCGVIEQTEYGVITVGKGILSLQECPACACAQLPPDRTIEFGESLSLPPMLPDCGVLAFWAQPEPGAGKGECQWEGFAVFETTPPVPVYLGTNARHLPEPLFLAVEVQLFEEDLCPFVPKSCMKTPPGRYGLRFGNDAPVFVGSPMVATIGFAAALPYLVTTRMASVDGDCREHVSWTALMDT